MRRILKWMGILLGALVSLVVIALLILSAIGRSTFNQTYEVDVPSLKIPTDEATVARGEHLVTAVAHCGYCHGLDLAGDIVENDPNTVGLIVAPNLTAGEGGIGAAYTTDDWLRSIRHGILPEGRSVILMPSVFFNAMSQEDLAAIVAYLQTIPPVDNVLPETELGPLAYLLLGAGPLREALSAPRIDHEAPFAEAPEEGATAAYGAYLAEIGQCEACHGEQLAGGQVSRSAPIGPNLTPGGELGGWTEADFVATLRTGSDPAGHQLDTFMPWQFFHNMTDTEIGALWAYLQSQPALESQLP